MVEKLQNNNGVALSDFTGELAPEQLARLTAIVNQEIPMAESALDDYVRTLQEYQYRNASRHAAELSDDELLNMVDRIRRQKK